MTDKKNVRLQIIFVAVGLAVNFILFFIKLYTGLSTNSISIYADAVNNGIDSLDCVAVLISLSVLATRVSGKYPFGFGRAQNITDFIISVSVAITGFYFGYISFERLMYPTPIWFSMKYAYLIGATAVVKAVLAVFYSFAAKRVSSYTIRAMITDSLLDFFITLSTLVSFTLSEKVGYSLDGAAGILIAVILTIHGIKMVVETFAALLGKNDEAKCAEAESIMESEGVTAENTVCHLYGEKAVFTTDITGSITDEQKAAVKQKINERLGAEIYFG